MIECVEPRDGFGWTQGHLVDQVIKFEEGGLDYPDFVELFQHLVDTGMAWQLQGIYGRTAHDLIEAGEVIVKEDATT